MSHKKNKKKVHKDLLDPDNFEKIKLKDAGRSKIEINEIIKRPLIPILIKTLLVSDNNHI